MKKRRWILTVLLVAALAATAALTGCGGNADAGASDDAAGSDAAQDAGTEAAVTQILVGNAAGPKPYAYTNENDELVGYEVDVINAIDTLLPQYEFSFEVTEFTSIFAGIDSGRYQMGTNNFTKKPEREEKYLFANEYFVYNYTVAVVKKGREDIKTLDDLGGKTTEATAGGFAQIFFETYNETHPDNPIIVNYTEADTVKLLQNVAFETIDFTFLETVMFEAYEEEYPELTAELEYVEFSKEETSTIQDPYAWYIYPKTADGEALRDAVDAALLDLVADGTLAELSIRHFGFDMTGR
ncbi:MAG: transporter substrate-binding domain-containing protein [Clostridiales Family XIII bacterium]|jgi:polar amino acid transport system substrate-binding protein|nr:transporter substrate-binding domain-containing protein [Clostridiales Family XIII bacterium]